MNGTVLAMKKRARDASADSSDDDNAQICLSFSSMGLAVATSATQTPEGLQSSSEFSDSDEEDSVEEDDVPGVVPPVPLPNGHTLFSRGTYGPIHSLRLYHRFAVHVRTANLPFTYVPTRACVVRSGFVIAEL